MNTNNEEILEKLYELGTGQREIISGQQQFMAAQLQLIAGQAELLLLFRELGERLLRGISAEVAPEEVWLTKDAVMDLLCITESTFYRRLADCNWERKRNGRRWYYLKSSVI